MGQQLTFASQNLNIKAVTELEIPSRTDLPSREFVLFPRGTQNSPPCAASCHTTLPSEAVIKNQDGSTKCFGFAFGGQGQYKSKFDIICFKTPPLFSELVAASGPVDVSSPKPHPTPKRCPNSSRLCPSSGFAACRVIPAEICVLFHADLKNHFIQSKPLAPSVPPGTSDVFHVQPTPSQCSWNCWPLEKLRECCREH